MGQRLGRLALAVPQWWSPSPKPLGCALYGSTPAGGGDGGSHPFTADASAGSIAARPYALMQSRVFADAAAEGWISATGGMHTPTWMLSKLRLS